MFDARWASLAEPVFRRIGTGADFSEALAIAQDADGFMWIGTQHGLIRWDGYRSRVYRADVNDPGALHDAFVNRLYVDRTGSLWIGTRSSGLAKYDAAADRFVTYPVGRGGFPYPLVNGIAGDSHGNIWVATGSGDGLASVDRLDITTGEVRTLISSKDNIDARARSLLVDSDDTLWIGTLGGLLRCEHGIACRNVVFPGTPQVRSLYESGDHTLWIGTLADGVFSLRHGSALPQSFGKPLIRSVYDFAEPAPGELWIASLADGLFVVDVASGRVRHVEHNRAVATSLPNEVLSRLYRDRSGLIWVGSAAGLATYDPQSAVLTIPSVAIRAEGSTDTWINVLLPASDGSVWAGTATEGVYVIDPAGGRPRHLAPLNNQISGLAEAHGTIFISDTEGVARTTIKGDRVERFSLRPRQPAAATNDIVANDDRLWVLGFDGLWSIDAHADPSALAERARFTDQLSDQMLTKLIWQTPNRMWLGTRNGLNRIDIGSNTVNRFMAAPGNPTALQNGSIKSLVIDRQQRLWVATATGLYRASAIDDPQLSFQSISLGELQTPTILAMLQAGDGTIWISTSEGLVEIDPTTLATHVLQRAEGVVNQFRTDNSACVTAQNELMFGGIDGITVVRPDRLQSWAFMPPLSVTDMRIGERRVSGGRYDHASGESATVVVAADDHRLAVEFAALDYTSPERNRYAYRLEGFDRDWIATEPNVRTASYTDLPPGDFVLRLRGSNRAGVWSNHEIAIPIHVLPPWYRTAWAFVLYAMAFIAALWLAGAWRVRRAERATRILENTVTERTAALASANAQLDDARRAAEGAAEAKSAFLANMSHEIRTPMNAVIGFAQLGTRQAFPAKALDYFGKIANSGKNLLGIVNDILDFSKIESGRLVLERVPFQVRPLLDQVRDLFSMKATEQHLDFSIACAANVPDHLLGDPLRVNQVLINLVGNALKFTAAGHVRLAVSLRERSDDAATLHFAIEDSGIGMDEAQRARLFVPFSQADSSTTRMYGGTGLGLTISQRIVEQMGGKIEVTSTPGRGSVFAFDAAFAIAQSIPVDESLEPPSVERARDIRVLLAEDNPINQQLVIEILADVGISVTLASTGEEAVELATRESFDCILMDIQMPGMDGHVATARIRRQAQGAEVPIIAMTAHASAAFRDECLAAGMNDYITKPIDARVLIDTLSRWTRADR
jgi:signal transduction histidine kinase/ligand-binding sensor domain-containing protein/ActR/RegA family two-component response regulator